MHTLTQPHHKHPKKLVSLITIEKYHKPLQADVDFLHIQKCFFPGIVFLESSFASSFLIVYACQQVLKMI